VTADLDLRVEGTFFYGFRGPKVPQTWALWPFTEVEAPRRLGFVISFADANRNVAPRRSEDRGRRVSPPP
jgi:uncharacterized protein YndB with AHSA1/START domain